MIEISLKKLQIKPQLSTTGGTSDARFIKNSPMFRIGLVGKTMHKVDEAVSLSD